MNRIRLITAPLALCAALSIAPRAHADCKVGPASFAELGAKIGTIPAIADGDLLNVRLLTHRLDACRLAWEIEALSHDGRIERIALDASTLDPVAAFDRDEWFADDDGEALDAPERETEEEIEDGIAESRRDEVETEDAGRGGADGDGEGEGDGDGDGDGDD